MFDSRRIDYMSKDEFAATLEELTTNIINLVRTSDNHHIKHIAESILNIKEKTRFVQLVESIFTADSSSYLRLIHEGSREIATRRKEITG